MGHRTGNVPAKRMSQMCLEKQADRETTRAWSVGLERT